jgi:hypothetical protein
MWDSERAVGLNVREKVVREKSYFFGSHRTKIISF